MALTPSSSRVSSGSMESLMAARVRDMSTSTITVLLPMSLIIRENEVSPSPSVDSDSLLAAPREDRKSVVSTASCGCRKSAVSMVWLARNLLGLLAGGMAMLRGRALLGLTEDSCPLLNSLLLPAGRGYRRHTRSEGVRRSGS